MSERSIESQVASFLDRREAQPELRPEDFVRELGGGDELLEALRAALGVESALRRGGAAARREIGPYRTVRAIGRGGMGEVFEVERDGRRYALKRMHASLASTRARQRFAREAELLRRVEHPGIVAVHDFGDDDGVPYLVLELVDGALLLDAAQTWPLDRKLRAVVEVCEAVAAAHDRGLLHRDLKPQNVLVRSDGRAVVLDFGLGVAEDDVTLTSTGDVLGTPRYMAPEQARAEPVDVRTDVWGLGQILFELVVGRPAIDSRSREQTLRDVANGRIPRPRELRADLPGDLERVLLQALAEAPERRYPNARELAADLERLRSGVAVLARPPGVLSRTWRRVQRRPAASIGALVVASMAAFALLTVRSCAAQERARRAQDHTELALLAWTGGDVERARSELSNVLEFAPGDDGARSLLGALDGVEPGSTAAARAFDAITRGRMREGADALEELERSGSIERVAQAHARRVGGETEKARRLLDALAREHPYSAVVAAERGRALRDEGAHLDAAGEFELALSLAPNELGLRLELAESLLLAGHVARGVEAALAASREDPAGRAVTPPRLARTLARAPDARAMRAELARVLAAEPGRADARFALAVSLDSAHEVRAAAQEYRAVLAVAPEHPFALAYLGHLRAGADRDKCEACRTAFDAAPELEDRDEAGELLARALEADRGRDADLTKLVVFLTREHRLETAVIEKLEELLAGELTTAQRSRLLDARQGLSR